MAGKLRIAPQFPRHLFFEELLINNAESRDISTNNKMHGNTIVIKNYDKIKIKKYVCSKIIW